MDILIFNTNGELPNLHMKFDISLTVYVEHLMLFLYIVE